MVKVERGGWEDSAPAYFLPLYYSVKRDLSLSYARASLSRSLAHTLSLGAHGAVGGRVAQGGGSGAAPALERARR